MHSCQMERKGFTLIELLIVVAIIAILAAIAVPNFLEAQTRAKVSRTKADMRSLATALESYVIDYNKYPIAYSLTVRNTSIEPRLYRLSPLTSPVAYMTSIPEDVFSRDVSATYTPREVRVFIYVDRYSYALQVDNPFGTSSNGDNSYRILWRDEIPQSLWLLRSRGPKGIAGGIGDTFDRADIYDATNGTLSNGNVAYFGPGIGFLDGK